MEAVAGEFQPQVGATAATGVAEGWSRLGTLHAGLVSTLARLLAGKLRDEGQAELATATASTTVALIFLLLLPSALPTRHKAAGTAAAVAGRLMFWALPGMRGSILSALEVRSQLHRRRLRMACLPVLACACRSVHLSPRLFPPLLCPRARPALAPRACYTSCWAHAASCSSATRSPPPQSSRCPPPST